MHEFSEIIKELATFITSCGIVLAVMKKWLIDPLEMSSIKTDLVNFINDVENGQIKSQIQILNAHELYDRYTKLGGNSYVHEHWSNLEKEGKI